MSDPAAPDSSRHSEPKGVIRPANGQRWRVTRRWITRKSRIREKFKRGKDGDLSPFDALDALSLGDDLAGLAIGIALGIALMVIVILLLPLIGVMFEIALLVALIASGTLGRVLSIKPWIIDATNLDDPTASRRYAARGWLRSRRAIAELRESLAAGGLPSSSEAVEIGAAADAA